MVVFSKMENAVLGEEHETTSCRSSTSLRARITRWRPSRSGLRILTEGIVCKTFEELVMGGTRLQHAMGKVLLL